MKKIYFLHFILLGMLTKDAHAQNWEKTYSFPAQFQQVQTTSDSGFLVIGSAAPSQILKLDNQGNTIYTKSISTASPGGTIITTNDNGSLFFGAQYVGGATSYMYLEKYDSQGNTLWTKLLSTLASTPPESIIQLPDSTYALISGNSIMKIDQSGNQISSHNILGITGSIIAIERAMDGGFFLLSRYYIGSPTYYGTELIKTNSQGDTTWVKTFPNYSTGFYSSASIKSTQDSGLVFAGNYNNDAILVKLNAQGDTLWTKTYGGGLEEEIRQVQKTTDGGYVLVGYSTSYSGSDEDVFIVKTDAQGNEIWSNTYGSPYDDEGEAIKELSTGGYVVSGSKGTNNINLGYVFTLNANGTVNTRKLNTIPNLSFSPNPTSSIVNINLNKVYNQIDLSVVNTLGQTILTKTYKNQEQIDLSLEGETGLYFVYLRTSSNEHATLKILKK